MKIKDGYLHIRALKSLFLIRICHSWAGRFYYEGKRLKILKIGNIKAGTATFKYFCLPYLLFLKLKV